MIYYHYIHKKRITAVYLKHIVICLAHGRDWLHKILLVVYTSLLILVVVSTLPPKLGKILY